MGKSVVLAGFACAAIGLCVWFLASGPDPIEAAGIDRAGEPTAGHREGAGSTALMAPASTEPEGASAPAVVQAPIAPAGSSRAVAARAREDDEDALELHVVGPDGEALADAEVFVLPNAGKETRKRFYEPNEIDALMESEGRRRSPDASGVVKVPPPRDEPTLVLGRRGDLWGARSLRPDREAEERLRLELELDVTLRARVVDRAGAPVPGVTVNVTGTSTWGSWTAQQSVAEGEDAVAVLRHVQDRVSHDRERRWALELDVLFAEPAEHELDPDAFPRETVTLVVPRGGSVEVAVYDDDHEPYSGEGTVTLGIIGEGEPKRLSPFSNTKRRGVERPIEDGIARFGFVEPGHELEVSVVRGGSSVATHAYGPGPSGVGQTRRIEVQLGSDHPVALLRAVDDEGQPIAGTELNVAIALTARFTSYEHDLQVRTDADGSFRVDLDANWAEGAQGQLLVSRGPADDPESSGRVDVSRSLASGVNDLGVVRLEPASVFVAGRVVTSTGEAVADAALTLQTRTEETGRWHTSWRFRYRTDENGAFEVRRAPAGDRFRIGALVNGTAGELQEFAPGDDGVVIELHPEGVLEGVVLVDAGFPVDQLRLSIKGDVDHLDYSDRQAAIGDDGAFRFGRLLPGQYDVTASFENRAGTVETVEDILIRSGDTLRDPRLDPLDLRGRYHAHHVTVVLPDEEPGIHGSLRFGPAGAEELEGRRWFYERDFWIIAEHELLDLDVDIQGCQSEHLESVGGEIELSPTLGRKVRMVLAADVDLPDPPLFLKAVLRSNDGTHHGVDWGAPAFDEGREITVSAPGTGEMQVVWIVEQRVSGSTSARMVDVKPVQVVEVGDDPLQRIEVTLTPEQRAKVVEGF